MRILSLCIILTLFSFLSFSQEENNAFNLNKWLKAGNIEVKLPVFNYIENTKGDTFGKKELLTFRYLNIQDLQPQKSTVLIWENNLSYNWKEIKTKTDSYIYPNNGQSSNIDQICYIASYIETDRFASLKLQCTSPQMFELYVNGEKKLSNYSIEKSDESLKPKSKYLELEKGKHLVVIKSFYEGNEELEWKIKVEIDQNEDSEYTIVNSIDSRRTISLNDILNNLKVNRISISDDGNYACLYYSKVKPDDGTSEFWFEIYDINELKTIFSSFHSKISNMKWIPGENAFSYKLDNSIWIYDIIEAKHEILLSKTKSLDNYTWSPDGKYFVYTISESPDKEKSGLKKIENMSDRQSWWRYRSQLYKFDISSGTSQRLTYGNISSSIQDICLNGNKLIFSHSYPNYKEIPYSRQIMFLINMNNLSIDTLWESSYSS